MWRSHIFAFIILLCVVGMSGSATPTTPKSHYALLEESDLRQILYEKTKGKVMLDNYRTRESLIAAISHLEENEAIDRELDDKVALALKENPQHQRYHIKFMYCTG